MMMNAMRAMRRSAILVLSLLVASCATAPSYERMTSDDCLVLVPTVIVNPEKISSARNYYLAVSDGRKPLEVKKNDMDFLVLLVREKGIRLTGISSNVSADKATGDSFKQGLNLLLPYERGKVLVADFTFSQTLKRESASRILTYWGFIDTKADVRASCIEMFKRTKAAATWFN